MDSNPNPTEQPKPTPVMDIQPPQPVSQSPDTTVDTPVAEAPAETEATTDTEQTPESVDAPVPATTEPEAPQALVATPSTANHHKIPVVPIIVAIVIAIALAVAAVLAYTKQQDKDQAASPTAQTTKTETTTTAAPTQDIDDTTKAVDGELNKVDDAKDFDSNSLSDSSLTL